MIKVLLSPMVKTLPFYPPPPPPPKKKRVFGTHLCAKVRGHVKIPSVFQNTFFHLRGSVKQLLTIADFSQNRLP